MHHRRGRLITFRVRKAMFAPLIQLASSLASLYQVLIVTGSIFEYARFVDAQRLRQFAFAAKETNSQIKSMKRIR